MTIDGYHLTAKGKTMVHDIAKKIAMGYELDDKERVMAYMGVTEHMYEEFLSFGEFVLLHDYLKETGVDLD